MYDIARGMRRIENVPTKVSKKKAILVVTSVFITSLGGTLKITYNNMLIMIKIGKNTIALQKKAN